MSKEEKCKKLGENCYDFTQMWCDDCLEQKISIAKKIGARAYQQKIINFAKNSKEWSEFQEKLLKE